MGGGKSKQAKVEKESEKPFLEQPRECLSPMPNTGPQECGRALSGFSPDERAFMADVLYNEPRTEREANVKYYEGQLLLYQRQLEEEMRERYVKRLHDVEAVRHRINEQRTPVGARERRPAIRHTILPGRL